MPVSLVQQGIAALRAGRPAEARLLCKRHLRENPGDPAALHLWGVTEDYAGRHEAAARVIELAVARRSDVAVFHNSLGVTYAKLGRYDDAAAALERAIALCPESEKFRKNLEMLGEMSGLRPHSMTRSDEAVWQPIAVDAFDVAFPDGLELHPPDNQEYARDALDIVFDEWD